MATKWSTPGITFREVDNSVRANADPGNGRGAIVLGANKGYPNQRILSTSLDDFYKTYGTPDNVNQYGHFAAANFFGAGSQQLLAVRATQGDEGYAQIQYPYSDASQASTNFVNTIEAFQYVDNQLTDQVVLIQEADSAVISKDALARDGFAEYGPAENPNFAFSAEAERAVIKDLFDEYNGDDSETMYVYRKNYLSTTLDDSGEYSKNGNFVNSGKFYSFASTDGENPKMVNFALRSGVAETKVSAYETWTDEWAQVNNVKDTAWYNVDKKKIKTSLKQPGAFVAVDLYIPQASALNEEGAWTNTFYVAESAASAWYPENVTSTTVPTIAGIINSANLMGGSVTDDPLHTYTELDAARITIVDWDDLSQSKFTIQTDDDSRYKKTRGGVEGVEFREYGMADTYYDLAVEGTIQVVACNDTTFDIKELNNLADEYGLDAAEISNDKYAKLTYHPAKTWIDEEDTVVKLVQRIQEKANTTKDAFTNDTKALFNLYLPYGEKKLKAVSSFMVKVPQKIVKPWQVDDDAATEKVAKMIAMPSSQVFSDSTGIWADGFTPSCQTEDEPGNGDIEQYENASLDNQLVIAAYGPGEWGNNIGIGIITAEAAQYPCLYHQNAFSWKYRYDDEDKVDAANNVYTDNAENLTWKKVYRINVYEKPKDKTAKVWGFGLDALTQDPVESWYVSNDPNAKDAEGNSLFAPYVINGRSNYIYVSKKSVNDATNYKGEISQPQMTWSIYQLQGGTNSTKNNIKEKTAALKLYTDRQKADFDILFNVEAIDTFNGKQRYSSHQRRIAEIAAQRGMDIGVIQTTSREAKTIKLELSEAKSFSFTNGSYIASYAGYDRYFDSYTSNWVYLPKSVAGACAMCYCDIYSYPWMAPAGLSRGQIEYSAGANIKHNDNEIGQLYDNNINTSRNCTGYGEVLWGQKTMLKKESALNRINVRRLLNYIEKNLEVMLLPYLYQNNTVNTRTSMKTTVDAFLSRIQAAEGIISKVVKVVPDAEDPHIVYVNVNLVPAESIEWICVTLTVDRNTGVTAVEG